MSTNDYEIPIGSLEEQALKRKERLRNLKRKQEGNNADRPQTNNVEAAKPHLPSPAAILKEAAQAATDESAETNNIDLANDDVVSEMTTQLENLRAPLVIEEIDIQNLAPRKPDWDLKRDVAKKLELLERRTQRAIAEIIRDRLRSNQTDIDLQAVNAVGYSATANATEADD